MIFGTLIRATHVADSRAVNVVLDSWTHALMVAGCSYVEARKITARKMKKAEEKIARHKLPVWLFENTYLVEGSNGS